MCGIAGIINFEKSELIKLKNALKHRGPDDQTIYQENNLALIHTRLAIQDIQNGIQPFKYSNYIIVFNGEIYNHHLLRKNLPEFSFKTNSDTETLLYLFIKYRYNMFDMIDGMYAFCIYDKDNNQLFLARDRAGKKPLYYYKEQDNFVFASELNAIKSIKKLNISDDAIACYLKVGMVWRPYTAYSNVYELQAGSYLVVDIETLSSKEYSYFDLLNNYHNKNKISLSFEESLQMLEDKLQLSVSNRILSSDVEVGIFLSGGIDSSLITAFATNVKSTIKTFTVKFDGLYDESPLAKLTARKFNTEHVELSISSRVSEDIEKILLSYGEPFMDSSAIPTYYISREAAKYVKVVLSGDGADELFGGYRRYVPITYSLHNYLKYFSRFLNFLPRPNEKKSMYNYLFRLISFANKKNLEFYLSATTDIFEDVVTIQNNKILDKLDEFIKQIFSESSLSSLDKMLYADFNIILFCDLLVKMDIASMANSLEVRSPFMSKYLIDFAPTLPEKYKIRGFKTKYILRSLAKKYLPIELIHKPKKGFEIPLKKWVNTELHNQIHDSLTSGCYSENFFSPLFIKHLLQKKLCISEEKRAKILWSFYCLETWYRNEKKNSIYS